MRSALLLALVAHRCHAGGPPADTEVALARNTTMPASSAKSTAAETKKENELFSWLRDKAGLSQAVIDKSKAKLSEEDVDSVEALQALQKLGDLADVFSRVPAQQIADALAAATAPEAKKNPWETGEPGHWDTVTGEWVPDPPQKGEKGGQSKVGEGGNGHTPRGKPVPAATLPPKEGRCGPLFNETRCDCSQASWAVFCVSANGWCGDSAEHATADDLAEYDCLTPSVAADEREAQDRRGPRRSLDAPEVKLQGLEDRCQVAGKRCQAATVPISADTEKACSLAAACRLQEAESRSRKASGGGSTPAATGIRGERLRYELDSRQGRMTAF